MKKHLTKLTDLFYGTNSFFENVSSKFVRALKSMYDVVKACIRYNSKHSDFLNSYTGLKQGDPSSPLLFMLFINDLVDNINANLENIFELDELMLFIILYADDAVVFAKSKESLQSLLNDIELYCGTWGLKINTRKTKVMIFEKGRHASCLFVLRFYGPVNPMGSCRARSVYLTTHLLGRLSPLSG